MTQHHLAQINIGRLLAPLDAPEIADFTNNLDRINALAEGTPGFVWRLVGEDGGSAATVPAYDDPLMAINLSVWTDIQAVAAFVYRTGHRDIMRRRREWFEEPTEAFQCLWWVPAGHRPTPAEALERLEHLRRHGPTPTAFTFREPFAAPGSGSGGTPVLDECA